MLELQKIYPHLNLFCDIKWEVISEEYKEYSHQKSFPEYLAEKSSEGDCPPYIFEMAFYEQTLYELKNQTPLYPKESGIYLNSTVHFLNLEFDIPKMIEQAQNGFISFIEKPHVLAIYKLKDNKIHQQQLSKKDLILLQEFENGPKQSWDLNTSDGFTSLNQLISSGILVEI